MAEAKADKQTKTGTLRLSDERTHTATDAWKAAEKAPERFTEDVLLTDQEIVSRKITDEINRDPEEAAKLRRSLQQAREGRTTPWRDADDDT